MDETGANDTTDARKTREVTPEHKAAMIQGRTETRVVRQYLEAIESVRKPRGRRRSKEALQDKLNAIEEQLASAKPIDRLHLSQDRIDLQKALEIAEQNVDLAELEEAFISIAASYGERKGLSYQAWREVGVEARVLHEAGIS